MDLGSQFKLLMLAIWLGSFAFSAKKFIRGRASMSWPTTIASVYSSDIEEKSGRNGLTFYSPLIEYQYSINNKPYQSSIFTFMGTSGFTREYALKYQSMYPVGSEIEVYYNPINPEISVIVPGVHWGQYASMVLITILLFGIANIVEILNVFWPGCEPRCT